MTGNYYMGIDEFSVALQAVKECGTALDKAMADGKRITKEEMHHASELASELENFQMVFGMYVEYSDGVED